VRAERSLRQQAKSKRSDNGALRLRRCAPTLRACPGPDPGANGGVETRPRARPEARQPLMAALVLAPILALFAVSARAAAPVSAHAPVTIPSIAAWVGSDGTPTADAWQHAARFRVDNEIQPGHNIAAP